MKYDVQINQGRSGYWALTISFEGSVYRAWSFKRLIEALDMASVLQLHVSNIATLPLRQYSRE